MFVEEIDPPFWKLPRADQRLLLEAWLWLGIGRIAMSAVPFSHVHPRLGQTVTESPVDISPYTQLAASRVAWAVEKMRWFTPWTSNCMIRAIAAQRLLRCRGIDSTLYIGIGKADGQEFDAHAWLRCGNQILSGKSGHEQYAVVAHFAQPEPGDPDHSDRSFDSTTLEAVIQGEPFD